MKRTVVWDSQDPKKADSDGIIAVPQQLAAGEEVRIVAGPFAGLLGVIRDPPDAKGRLKVLMQLLHRPMTVAMPTQFVESKWSI